MISILAMLEMQNYIQYVKQPEKCLAMIFITYVEEHFSPVTGGAVGIY